MIEMVLADIYLVCGGCNCICAMPDVTILSGGKGKGLSYEKCGEGLPFPMGNKKDEEECQTACFGMLQMKMISCD